MSNVVLIISLIIAILLFGYFLIKWKVLFLNKTILKTLILFFASIFIFSIIYTISYKINNSCFYYSDFLRNQKNEELNYQTNKIQDKIDYIREEIEIYKAISEYILNKNNNWKPQSSLYVSTIEFTVNDINLDLKFENILSPSKSSNSLGQRFYFNLTKNGVEYDEIIFSRPLPDSIYKYHDIDNSTYEDQLKDFLLPLSSQEYKLLFDDFNLFLQNELNSLLGNRNIEKTPEESFNYGDFVYYSIVTQTTIGATDIYPNSDFMRILISIQALISVFITVFLINNTMPKEKNTNP